MKDQGGQIVGDETFLQSSYSSSSMRRYETAVVCNLYL